MGVLKIVVVAKWIGALQIVLQAVHRRYHIRTLIEGIEYRTITGCKGSSPIVGCFVSYPIREQIVTKVIERIMFPPIPILPSFKSQVYILYQIIGGKYLYIINRFFLFIVVCTPFLFHIKRQATFLFGSHCQVMADAVNPCTTIMVTVLHVNKQEAGCFLLLRLILVVVKYLFKL